MNPLYPDLPVLGIDVSKLTFDACLLSATGSKTTAQFSNDAKGFARLDAWLKTHSAVKTLSGLEATGPYSLKLLQHLQAKGHVACQLNPRRVKDYGRSQGRRIKTDRADAALIASHLNTSERLMPWRAAAKIF
jgi:transposase